MASLPSFASFHSEPQTNSQSAHPNSLSNEQKELLRTGLRASVVKAWEKLKVDVTKIIAEYHALEAEMEELRAIQRPSGARLHAWAQSSKEWQQRAKQLHMATITFEELAPGLGFTGTGPEAGTDASDGAADREVPDALDDGGPAVKGGRMKRFMNWMRGLQFRH